MKRWRTWSAIARLAPLAACLSCSGYGGPVSITLDAGTGEVPTPGDVRAGPASDTGCNASLCGAECVDLQANVRYCGACTNDCTALPNVDPSKVQCLAGSCDATGACMAGWAQCGADVGCATSLSTQANCGACGAACAEPTPTCAASSGGAFQCVSGCSGATPTRCNGSCVDLQSNAADCGACGAACASGQVCQEGKCKCPPHQLLCPPSASCVSSCEVCAGASFACKSIHACVPKCSWCSGEDCK